MLKRISAWLAGTPQRYDVALLGPTLVLVGLGVVMVFSASGVPAGDRLGDSQYYLWRQATWAILGLILLLAATHVPYARLARLAPLMLLGAVLLLIAVHIPGIGATRGGATRWIALGPFSIQPAEAAKLAMIFYLARYYAGRDALEGFSDSIVKPALICAPLIVLVLLQPDFGTAATLAGLFVVMAFTAGARMRYLLAAGSALVPAGIALVLAAPYRVRRLMAFVDPWADAHDGGFQIIQSMLGFAGGGVFGRGLGDGLQKLYFLPEAHSDFVLALVGEELGLIGVLIVLGAFATLVFRGLGVAANHGDSLARMIAVGLTAIIGIQALINGGVVLGVLPTKGITLPFVSYGGSSLLAMMTAVGVLMNVSATSGEEAT